MLFIDRPGGIEDERIWQGFHGKTLLCDAAIGIEENGNFYTLTLDIIANLSQRFDLVGIDRNHGNALSLELFDHRLKSLHLLLAGFAPECPEVHKYRSFTKIRGKCLLITIDILHDKIQ